MAKIYVVFGTTGEYSDRSEWPVAAYSDKKLAQRHVELATRWFDANAIKYPNDFGPPKIPNPFDPDMRVDYTGTSYYLEETELRDDLPDAAY